MVETSWPDLLWEPMRQEFANLIDLYQHSTIQGTDSRERLGWRWFWFKVCFTYYSTVI